MFNNSVVARGDARVCVCVFMTAAHPLMRSHMSTQLSLMKMILGLVVIHTSTLQPWYATRMNPSPAGESVTQRDTVLAVSFKTPAVFLFLPGSLCMSSPLEVVCVSRPCFVL